MQKRSFFVLIAGTILLASCSGDNGVTPQACTFAMVPDFHLMTLKTSMATPERMAVIVDGQLKYDECLEHPVLDQAPTVYLLRVEGAVEVLVQHHGAYSVLPTKASYKLLDRG